MKTKTKTGRTVKQELAYILRGYKILYEVCPRNMIYRTFYCLVCTLMPYFPLYMSSRLIDEIAAGATFERLLTLAAVTVCVTLLLQILQHVAHRKAQELQSINWQLNFLYLLKAQCRMQYSHFENPETALLIENIRSHANYGGHGLTTLFWHYWGLLGSITDIIASVSLTFSMLAVVENASVSGFLAFVNTPWSALLILLLIGISIAVQWVSVNYFNPRSNKLWSDFNRRFARNNCYFDGDSVDGRIFNATRLGLLHSRETLVKDDYLREHVKLSVKRQFVNRLFQFLLDIALFTYVGAKAFMGVFGIGSFVLYRGTVEKFVRAVTTIGGAYGTLRQNNEYLEEVFRLLDLPDEMYHGTLSVEKRDDNRYEIEFRNVSFQYPGSDTYALRNVSFKFRIGERLAFVGMNGSGKTTFIKLLCRLYDPTEGKILLNGIDITRYKYDEYMNLFSVVFQDFQLFGFTVGENLSAKKTYDRERATACLEKAGFGDRLATLPRGLDTPIGVNYQNDGEEMSGGERQKIAIARALYKDAPFIILDEPTAALDPLAEAEIYAKFNEIVDNKTAIYISHRLSSCRFCDTIVVFHEGELIQKGSHDILIADPAGQYYALWNAQARYYTE